MLAEAQAEAFLAQGTSPPSFAYDADVIILALNRFSETVEAVESALRQTGLSLHVMVLDQGSEPEVQERFVARFAGLDKLAFYTIGRNFGVGGGRNRLAALGHGRVIIALDNDAIFENETVAAGAMAVFEATPELGAIGFKILDRDGVRLDEFSWGYPARLKSRYQERFETTTFVGAGHAIRRSTWTEVGGYDETLFFTWEEYDFCLAAIALGWQIMYEGSLGIIHKTSSEARISWGSARVRYSVRNRLVIARKWGTSWVGLLPRIFGYIVKGVFNGCLRPTLNGISEAIHKDAKLGKSMPAAMRQYLFRNERIHRGSLMDRIRIEIFGRINRDPV